MEEPKPDSVITVPAPVVAVDITQQKAERENKLKNIWKSPLIFIPVIILLICLGVFIRIQPIADHNGNPGLIDITTGTWTLGPDLDPFLFVRYAKTIEETGSIPAIDMMRYYPLGYLTSGETTLLPRMIYWTKLSISAILGTLSSNGSNFEKYTTMNFAGIIFPVIMFAFTILAFFLFVYTVFSGTNNELKDPKHKKIFAGIIASISSLFMIIMPAFLSRTIAGIPEKESAGFFFLFISLYFFVLTLKSQKFSRIITFGFLAGITTALMALVWGGVTFVYATIAVTCLLGLILDKIKLEQKIAYMAWFSSSLIIIQMFSTKFAILGFFTSLDTGLATLAFAIVSISVFIDKLKKKQWEKYIGYTWLKEKTKLPENILVILISIAVLIVLASIVVGPTFILDKLGDINRVLFNPAHGGRWVTTVAENQQPYFTQWYGNFGIYAFIVFLAGSVLFYWKMLGSSFEIKEKVKLIALYLFFFCGLVFSRYTPTSLLNGENFISKAFYLISALCFIGGFIYYYIKGERTGRKMFKDIDISWLLLLVLFILALFTARSAVRLIMVVTIIAPIFMSYLLAQTGVSAIWGDKSKKIGYWVIFAIVLIVMAYSANAYYTSSKAQAYQYVPYYYTFQWQEAMSWIRTSTPTDAVFAHWWDYGYWVQSIGNRATMTDGGNIIVYWNYLTGRYVLTGDNQKESLEVLYAHNISYLLIDSSDMGKYGAFSQIGSDINFDRLSSGPITMTSSESNLVETKKGYSRIYQGASYIDEDIKYNQSYLFKENSAIVGMELTVENNTYIQPIGIYYQNGQNIRIPLRYLYFNNQLIDYGSGLEAAAYPIQNILINQNNQISIDPDGGVIYLSPRIFRGYLGQVYILNDPLNRFPNFKIAHVQQDYILKMISTQTGIPLGEFTIYQGIKGPIKIWSVTYPEDTKYIEKYNSPTFPADVNWTF